MWQEKKVRALTGDCAPIKKNSLHAGQSTAHPKEPGVQFSVLQSISALIK
jgi:hypothetical protein